MKQKNMLVVITILFGTLLEWYDFSLFASMAPIIAKLFFPSVITTLSLLAAFGVFASGFIMLVIMAVSAMKLTCY